MWDILRASFEAFLMLIAGTGMPVMCGFLGPWAIAYLLDKYDGEESPAHTRRQTITTDRRSER